MSPISGNEYPYGRYVIIIANNPHAFSLHYINESESILHSSEKRGRSFLIAGKLSGVNYTG